MALEGKRVVVVGASAGIGRAFAVLAHKAGADVVLGARRAEVLDDVVAEAGGGTPITVDVTDPASCDSFLSAARDKLGELDLVLCTAGTGTMALLETIDDDTWTSMMATNVFGLSRLLCAAVPMLSSHGVVAVLSSETATAPRRGLVPYAASKAALEATLQGVRVEHPGTRVSCVVVGATFPTEFGSDFDADVLGPAMESWQRHGLLQQEFMAPEEVAGCLVDLYGSALQFPGVCLEHVVLRSPSPVFGETTPG